MNPLRNKGFQSFILVVIAIGAFGVVFIRTDPVSTVFVTVALVAAFVGGGIEGVGLAESHISDQYKEITADWTEEATRNLASALCMVLTGQDMEGKKYTDLEGGACEHHTQMARRVMAILAA